MPDTVQFRNGNQIVNSYSASGQKLRTEYITAPENITAPINGTVNTQGIGFTRSGTAYNEHIEYSSDNGGNLYLDRIHNSEGYVDLLNKRSPVYNSDRYNYYRRDHLGNNREVWRASYKWGSTTYPASTVQRTQYYPSGLPWKANTGDNPGAQPYKFNGCEFIETHGYDVTDLGNRGVYHAINRFTSIDRFAEKFPWQSPYVHAGNNPVNNIDVNGDAAIWGAIIGAGLDYTIQVAGNVITDGGLSVSSFTNVDGKSIAVSALTGATGVGLGSKVNQVVKLAKLGKTATTVVRVAGEAAVDATLSTGSQLVENGEVSLGQVAIDVGAGAAGGKLGDKVQTAKQASSEGKILQRQADRAQRLASSDNAKASRVEKAQQATKKADNYGKSQAAATSVATSTTVSKTYKEIEKIRQRTNP